MGRYYSGDIEGKFWFGTQPSNDADFFGVIGQEPNYLEYYFDTSHLPEIRKGIKECIEQLGKYKKALDKFFNEPRSYTDEQLAINLKVDREEAENLMKWYARLELGQEILKCVEDTESCSFEAEL